jgi:hypothetical protein
MKIVTSVADGSGLATVAPDRVRPTIPTIELDGGGTWQPTLTYRIGPPHSLVVEQELVGHRWEMITRYVADNDVNPMLVDPPDAWLGIVAAGHIAEMVMGPCILGLDGRCDLVLRVDSVLNPLDEGRRRLAAASTVLVVGDKLSGSGHGYPALYGSGSTPASKQKDRDGRALVPAAERHRLFEQTARQSCSGLARAPSPPKAESFRLVLGAGRSGRRSSVPVAPTTRDLVPTVRSSARHQVPRHGQHDPAAADR